MTSFAPNVFGAEALAFVNGTTGQAFAQRGFRSISKIGNGVYNLRTDLLYPVQGDALVLATICQANTLFIRALFTTSDNIEVRTGTAAVNTDSHFSIAIFRIGGGT